MQDSNGTSNKNLENIQNALGEAVKKYKSENNEQAKKTLENIDSGFFDPQSTLLKTLNYEGPNGGRDAFINSPEFIKALDLVLKINSDIEKGNITDLQPIEIQNLKAARETMASAACDKLQNYFKSAEKSDDQVEEDKKNLEGKSEKEISELKAQETKDIATLSKAIRYAPEKKVTSLQKKLEGVVKIANPKKLGFLDNIKQNLNPESMAEHYSSKHELPENKQKQALIANGLFKSEHASLMGVTNKKDIAAIISIGKGFNKMLKSEKPIDKEKVKLGLGSAIKGAATQAIRAIKGVNKKDSGPAK